MDPLAKAQELHTKLHNQLLAKDKLLAASELKVKELQAELVQTQKLIQDEKKHSALALEEKDAALLERVAELEEREEVLAQGQQALATAQAQLDAEKAAQKLQLENMEATVREIETLNLALTRERDATLATNAANQQHFHEQLISLSKNHLEQTNEDIQRIAALRAEAEEQKKQIAVKFTEQLVQAGRVEADLRAELSAARERAQEDAARWAEQKKEFEGIIAANADELTRTLKRVKESSEKELALLNEKITADGKLLHDLQTWTSLRQDKEGQWQAAKDELKFLRLELEKSITRYEKLEQVTSNTAQGLRRELEETKHKLSETELTLAKKSQALQIYHKEIKQNHAKLEEIKKLQAAQDKLHREEALKHQQQIAALGGKPLPATQQPPAETGFFSSLFKSSSDKAKPTTAPQQPQQPQQRKPSVASSEEDATGGPVGPKRSISGADDELTNDLNEEMAVSLSKRVEELEDERLSLTQELEKMKKKYQQAELLNQLHGKPATDKATSSSASAKTPSSPNPDSATDTKDGKKSGGLLGNLLGKNKDKSSGDPFSDPVKVKSILEEQVLQNQHLQGETENQAREIARLKLLLDATKTELTEAQKKEKLLTATQKGRKKAATGNETTDSSASSSTNSTNYTPISSTNTTASASQTQ